MNYVNVSWYSPYGAYELKARYQRNLLTATLLVTLCFGILLGAFYAFGLGNGPLPKPGPPKYDKWSVVPIPVPTVKHEIPRPGSNKRSVHTRDGIPRPVVDDSIPPELDVILPTNDERGMRFYGLDTGNGDGVGLPDSIDTGPPVDYIPPRDTFMILEIQPEMIYEAKPEYPRMARRIGQEGRVWIQVLLDFDGTVMQAVVARPTGMPLLEEAALKAASKNRFSPAIQNGRPVRVWVTYCVHFSLTSDVR